MQTSEQINELATALALAQGEMGNAIFDASNPHFKSKYATLAAIRTATVPHLSKNGLAVVQTTDLAANGMLLFTRLVHSSGQWIEGAYPIVADLGKPQTIGSALTYAKRYGWAAVCGIASEEDDDGNVAQDAAVKANQPPNEKKPAGNGTKEPQAPSLRFTELHDQLTKITDLVSLDAWGAGANDASKSGDISGSEKATLLALWKTKQSILTEASSANT